jgi:hypothetical protein
VDKELGVRKRSHIPALYNRIDCLEATTIETIAAVSWRKAQWSLSIIYVTVSSLENYYLL